MPKKQRHTAQRIFERLRDEHGFTGGITVVTDYVREKKRRTQEVFVPLSHSPGHAQVDFGEALGEISGVRCKLHYFAMALPHSDAFFIEAYPAETIEAFCDGHVTAFAFFGGRRCRSCSTTPRSRWRRSSAIRDLTSGLHAIAIRDGMLMEGADPRRVGIALGG